MFPKKGNTFPRPSHAAKLSSRYRAAIAVALKAELGDTHQAIKTVTRWTSANERTAKGWIAARNTPGGEHLIMLLEHSDGVLDAILRLANRRAAMLPTRLAAARDALSELLQLIEEIIEEE